MRGKPWEPWQRADLTVSFRAFGHFSQAMSLIRELLFCLQTRKFGWANWASTQQASTESIEPGCDVIHVASVWARLVRRSNRKILELLLHALSSWIGWLGWGLTQYLEVVVSADAEEVGAVHEYL